MTVQTDTLTAEQFTAFYRAVSWPEADPDQVREALRHTSATFTAYDGDRPVGMVRLISDYVMTSLIKDFIVLPEYQGQGVGRALLSAAEGWIRSHLQDGWEADVEVMARKEAKPFYGRMGLVPVSSLDDRAGMLKHINSRGDVPSAQENPEKPSR